MGLRTDIDQMTAGFFEGNYEITAANGIPAIESIGLGNRGRLVDMAMLFVDIQESTVIVDAFRRQTAAKMYKAFLAGVTELINANDGEVISFNGDGVLAGFASGAYRNRAVAAALNISWFVEETLRPAMRELFTKNGQLQDKEFDYGLGIDAGEVLVVRGGVHGDNDRVWVGNATNRSVKLSELGSWPYNIVVSSDIFYGLHEYNTKSGDSPMWRSYDWNSEKIYTSRWLNRPPL